MNKIQIWAEKEGLELAKKMVKLADESCEQQGVHFPETLAWVSLRCYQIVSIEAVRQGAAHPKDLLRMIDDFRSSFTEHFADELEGN